MYRNILFFFLLFFFCGSLFAQQLSDEQVVEYIIQAQTDGKTQKEIVTELMRRGITREQAERIQISYKNSSEKDKKSASEGRDRTPSDSRLNIRTSETEQESGPLTSVGEPVSSGSEKRDLSPDRYRGTEEESERKIYGHTIFRNPHLTFEPNINLATPADYRLGPGDEVIIEVWGASENSIRQTISPEGSIMVTNLGPVYLSGLTVKDANAYLQREFSKIYSGINGDMPSSEILLTLGNIRTIQINIMGEVAVPGTYRLSSFATVFHALYSAGGINPIGSLREIKVMRNGKLFITLDVYEYILGGRMNDDIRLMEGDVILVSPYRSLVEITGKVKRPMYYEMKSNETLGDLIGYAGGFTGEAYKDNVRLIRKGAQEYEIFTVEKEQYTSFGLIDGDEVSVDSVLNRFQNRIEVRGAVYRPGVYQLGESIRSVKELIEKADGLRGDAFLNRAVLHREKDDYTLEVLPINLHELFGNDLQDIVLRKNDVLYIPSARDLQEQPTIIVHGEVANPGTYLYADNTTLEDMIIQAGGLLEAAATVKVEISHRIKSPRSMYVDSTLGESFVFNLKDGLVVDGIPGFILQPFDEVYVRKSPAYQVQRNVSVNGEVLFAGNYALTSKNERLSDLIAKSGGLTADAYVNGARLIRKMNSAEIARQQATLKMADKGADSILVSGLDVSDIYNVGIELGKALRYPGSDYDLVLRDGDRLEVPEYLNTVRINGAVMYPNTTLYKQNARLKYYINRAGGYGARAKKNRAYVVNMNGTVSRVKRWRSSAIQPGSEIVVPVKPERKGGSIAETMSIATSTASLAAMVATIVNIVK